MGSRLVVTLVLGLSGCMLIGCGDSIDNGDTSAAVADIKANMSTENTPANPQPPKRLPDGVQNMGGDKHPGKFAGTGAGK